MRFMQRLTNVVSANLFDIVDRFEDPERMLRFAIREMEDAVESATRSAASVIATARLLERQLTAQKLEVDRLTACAEQSAQAGSEDAARRILRRRREARHFAHMLSTQLASNCETEQRLRCRLENLRHRLGEARSQLVALVARQRLVVAQRHLFFTFGAAWPNEMGESHFDRYRQQIDQSEAEFEALCELAGTEGPDDAEQTEEIEDELRALRTAGPA